MSFQIDSLQFNQSSISTWGLLKDRHRNWPVVYVLHNEKSVYVGETSNAVARLGQHLQSDSKTFLKQVRVVLDDTFNKSVCLDLESSLIKWFSGDSKFETLNRNDGIVDRDYFNRSQYSTTIRKIFEELRALNLFSTSLENIENGELFKYSPYKSLNNDQLNVAQNLLQKLADSIREGVSSEFTILGSAGTGKTILAVYLAMFLSEQSQESLRFVESDLGDLPNDAPLVEALNRNSIELLKDQKVALVIPQRALRTTLKRVVAKTPGLKDVDVLSTYEIGQSKVIYDLAIVDEAHRLQRRGNQSSADLNTKFKTINETLFGDDDVHLTQIDWVRNRSRHCIFFLDTWQTVRPLDVAQSNLKELIHTSAENGNSFQLKSQMRIRGQFASDYVDSVRGFLNGDLVRFPPMPDYEFKIFDKIEEMVSQIAAKNADPKIGLSRLVAGYAWKWVSRKDPKRFDIEMDGVKLRWNSLQTQDWITSSRPEAANEVGSIHTVQGYDLNFAGVIIGPDLTWNLEKETIEFHRENYFDSKGKEALPRLNIRMNNEAILEFVKNIYAVLLTRGILGTYVYVCDDNLRSRLKIAAGQN